MIRCLAHEEAVVNTRIRKETDTGNEADFDMKPSIGRGNVGITWT